MDKQHSTRSSTTSSIALEDLTDVVPASTMPDSTRARASSLTQRTGCIGALARFWQRSYGPDYTALALLLTAEILLQLLVTPFHRLFRLNDPRIQYPHADPERVSPVALLIYAALVPLAALLLWSIIARPQSHVIRAAFLGLFLSVFLTGVLTDVIKNAVGRPRPDLLARCKPKPGTPVDKLVGIEVCTTEGRGELAGKGGAHHVLHDGWRSFPSGHSSFAFSGLGYLSIFIWSLVRGGHHGTPLPLVLASGVPMLGAVLIAISRTEDYRHDVWDVTTGSVLGMVIAWVCWCRYFENVGGMKAWVRGEEQEGARVKRDGSRGDEEEGRGMLEER